MIRAPAEIARVSAAWMAKFVSVPGSMRMVRATGPPVPAPPNLLSTPAAAVLATLAPCCGQAPPHPLPSLGASEIPAGLSASTGANPRSTTASRTLEG